MSYGLTTGSIDSREIKNSAIRGKDVRNDGLTGADVRRLGSGDISDNSLTGNDVLESSLGKVPSASNADSANTANAADSVRPNGVDTAALQKDAVTAAKIADGAVGSSKLAAGIPRDVQYVFEVDGTASVDNNGDAECPAGKLPIGGGAAAPFYGATGFVAITVSRPARITPGLPGGDTFNGWYASAIEVNGGSTQGWGIGTYAICARL